RADNDSVNVADRRALRQHRERVLHEVAAVMLQKHQRGHSKRFSARKSAILCAPLPSSSIFTVSPRTGGSPIDSTSVFDPASPSCDASTPGSDGDRAPRGLLSAPKIPLS